MNVRLSPRASANKVHDVVETGDGRAAVKVSVTAVPESGKANTALLKLLAKALKVPKTSLTIIAGKTDRNKVVAIAGDPESLENKVRETLRGA